MSTSNRSFEKLEFEAYSDDTFQSLAGEPNNFVVAINPEFMDETLSVNYTERKPSGSSESTKVFNTLDPGELRMRLVLDSTGIGQKPHSKGHKKENILDKHVQAQVKYFKEMAFYIYGETHQPKFLRILWGESIFEGRLVSMRVKYNLFSTDGVAMRAILDLVFTRHVNNEKRISEERKSSPDLTHIRVTNGTDPLPLTTSQIYGSGKHYLEVARINELDTIMRLPGGQKLSFPPIDKQSR